MIINYKTKQILFVTEAFLESRSQVQYRWKKSAMASFILAWGVTKPNCFFRCVSFGFQSLVKDIVETTYDGDASMIVTPCPATSGFFRHIA